MARSLTALFFAGFVAIVAAACGDCPTDKCVPSSPTSPSVTVTVIQTVNNNPTPTPTPAPTPAPTPGPSNCQQVSANPASRPVSYNAGSNSFGVLGDCTFNVQSEASWIHITEVVTSGNKGVGYNYDRNDGGERTGRISLGNGAYHTVIQAAAPPPPPLVVTPPPTTPTPTPGTPTGPGTCPSGQVGTPPNCTTPSTPTTCVYTVAGNAPIPQAGGNIGISVNTNLPTCTWTATVTSPASIVYGPSGTGNGNVAITVPPGGPATMTAVIAGHTLTITRQ